MADINPVRVNSSPLEIKTKFSGKVLADFFVSAYQDNKSPALWVIAEDGEPLLTASVNPSTGVVKAGSIAIKDYSENEGTLAELIRLGFVEEKSTGIFHEGFVIITAHEMKGALLNAWNIFKVQLPKAN